jgi:hypothetical protein
MHNATLDRDDAAVFIAFDHLCDQPLSPDTQRLAAAPTGGDLIAERLASGAHVGAQPIATDEKTSSQRTSAHTRHQASDQGQVTMGAHLAPKPQPRGDHDCHGHPDDSPLHLDPQFIGLNLPEPPRRLN